MISSEQSTKQTRCSLQDEVLCERRQSEIPLRFTSNKEQPSHEKPKRRGSLGDRRQQTAGICPRGVLLISTRGITAAGRRWTSISFFRYTGMDFVKIQFELPFPRHPEIQRPEDWAKMPLYGKEFYQPQLEVVEGLVREAGDEALVVLTLYSPFMLAGEAAGADTVEAHVRENPEATKRGIGIIAESLPIFVQEYIRLGVDGFYHSTEGGRPPAWAQTGSSRSLSSRSTCW